MAVLALACVPLVLLLRRARPTGQPIAAH